MDMGPKKMNPAVEGQLERDLPLIPAGRNIARNLLPGLAELALEPVPDHGIPDRLRHCEAEPGLAGLRPWPRWS